MDFKKHNQMISHKQKKSINLLMLINIKDCDQTFTDQN